MIIVKVHGGLGNQLFEYALGKALSIKHKTPLYIDTRWYGRTDWSVLQKRAFLLDDFKAAITPPSSLIIARALFSPFNPLFYAALLTRHARKLSRRFFIEKGRFVIDQNIIDNSVKGAYLDGYWQNGDYFSSVRKQLLEDITLNDTVANDPLYISGKKKIEEQAQSVSLHIRRTDFVNNPNVGSVCDLNYYNKALEKASEMLDNPVFFVFSDDIAWSEANLPKQYTYVFMPENADHPTVDLVLMSSCKAHIIANSTFSWWGAWLDKNDNALVIGPKMWNLESPEHNIMLPNWIRI